MPAVLQRIVLFLGVCLPVPLLAATGLSIPLPATVERLAAQLVPFAEAATLEASDKAGRRYRGVIVRTPTEKRPVARKRGAAPSLGSVTRASRKTRPAQKPVRPTTAATKPKPSPAKNTPSPRKNAPGASTETPQPQPAPQPA